MVATTGGHGSGSGNGRSELVVACSLVTIQDMECIRDGQEEGEEEK